MGLRKIQFPIFTILAALLGMVFVRYSPVDAQSLPAEPAKKEEVTPWSVVKKKELSNYKIEISQRMTIAKFPRVESMKARIIPKDGGAVTEFEGTWVNPDPKSFLLSWKGGLLDVDGDGVEDLILQNYSGGGHCCYTYTFYSLKTPLKKLGEVEMKDCGEKISLEDLNGDKVPELISCNPDFTYLGELPYSESPFPPAVYILKDGGYKRADRNFKTVFQSDIQAQRDALAKGYRHANALQIVADYLVLGDEASAWKEFEALYQGADKEVIKVELAKRTGLKAPAPEPKPAISPPPGKGPSGDVGTW